MRFPKSSFRLSLFSTAADEKSGGLLDEDLGWAVSVSDNSANSLIHEFAVWRALRRSSPPGRYGSFSLYAQSLANPLRTDIIHGQFGT